jgi:hypothetical protein
MASIGERDMKIPDFVHRMLPNPLERWLDKRAAVREAFAEFRSKSLRDTAMGTGAQAVVVAGEAGKDPRRLFRKANPLLLRSYAEYSCWVRAAIDIYRQNVAMAQPLVAGKDPAKKMNGGVQKRIEALLQDPNRAEMPYSELKEIFVEDFLVIGHGALEKQIRRNTEPEAFFQLDAGRIGMVAEWDGTNPSMPRYAEMTAPGGRVKRWLPDAMCMCLVNRPRSYDKLGLSHVEVLDTTVRALLEGDQTLLNQTLNPAASGMIDLGKGVPRHQVAQIRSEMEHLRNALIVIANSEGSRFHSFEKVRQLMRQLDAQIWFVREVAAVFQIPMAKLQVAVDQSRANTQAQFDEMAQGPMRLLQRMMDLENANISLKFGTYESHNCMITYPVLSAKDQKEQAEINKIGMASQPFMSVNDARRGQGLEPLDAVKHPGAEELWFSSSKGPVPLSTLEKQYITNELPMPGEPTGEDGGKPNKPAQGEDSATVN